MAYTLGDFLDAPPSYVKAWEFPLQLGAEYCRRAVLCETRPASLADLLHEVEATALRVPILTASDFTDAVVRRVFGRWLAQSVYGDHPWPEYLALLERERIADGLIGRAP